MKFTEMLELFLLSSNLVWLSFLLCYTFYMETEKKTALCSLCLTLYINLTQISLKTTVLCHATLMIVFFSSFFSQEFIKETYHNK